MSDIAHGTRKGYERQGCRCDECRRSNTERSRRYAARLRCPHCGGPKRNTKAAACRACYLAAHSGKYAGDKYSWQRDYDLRRKYGVSLDEFNAILAQQGNVCAICGLAVDKFALDHDHASGRVRGVLCEPCNKGLGFFYDDPDRLQSAIAYLTGASNGHL